MKNFWITGSVAGFVFGALVCCGYAELTLDPLFTSKMVLQRNRPVAVYGTANAGDTVTVEFAPVSGPGQAGQVKTAVADSSRHWKVFLDPMPASTKPWKMTIRSSTDPLPQEFDDVLVGDVWLCAGQSNMASVMKNYPALKDDIREMNNGLVRLFKTKHEGVGCAELSDVVVPGAALRGSWQALSPEFAAEFSATACFFGRALQPQAGVPVGLLYANRGGTQVNMWLPLDVMQRKPELYGRFLDRSWPEWTPRPQGNPGAVRAPSYLYNGTIHPLIRYAIRGAIWYQGESDAMFAGDYPAMIKDLIGSWREAWGYEFPFLCVQLAPYGAVVWDNSGESWAWQREAQMAALDLPKTELAVITDAGEFKDIHPQNKRPVGERLALLAASLDDPSVPARSPVMQSVRFQQGKAGVTFSNTEDGLEVRRLSMNRNERMRPGDDPEAFVVPADVLSGFEICGKDRHFKRAQAVLTGPDTVCVWSDEVPSPVAVRYGWANFPLCNLYNSVGLPASPFRSDSFEMPDFSAMPDFEESAFGSQYSKQLVGDHFDETLSGWRKSSPDLRVEQLDGRLGIYLPNGKNESLLSTGQADSGKRFRVQTDLKVLSPRVWGGVVFNCTSPNDYYVFRFCSGTVQAQFIHYINKSPRVLQSFESSKPFAANTVYRMEVLARPNDPYGDGAYLFKVINPAAQETLLRGARIDFGGGMPGGAAGCYIGTPSTRSFFTYDHFIFDVE
ncbi:sialate O-acetylesterase [Tichowtungia aerotolerans]|uniref:Sialate O-acetylesterase domain-containing protein n=1 Tax=Tichowtungia aerotolerans TaxID=2697043 RepID=A0A6P1M1U3_9BACT|nr:sialate O-acetylesterase [Tichowtungia aerotolerans]QHI68789.1 hypothetical protein GT409_04770 [Tichowtungia aerotolerans]